MLRIVKSIRSLIMSPIYAFYNKCLWYCGLSSFLYLSGMNGFCCRKVIFLCKGNICRSPYAEYKFKQLINSCALSDVSVESAGLYTDDGKVANSIAAEVANEFRVDLSSHSTRRFSVDMVCDDVLFIVMTRDQASDMRRRIGHNRSRILVLGALSMKYGLSVDISDPYAKSTDVFRKCFLQINMALNELVQSMKS